MGINQLCPLHFPPDFNSIDHFQVLSITRWFLLLAIELIVVVRERLDIHKTMIKLPIRTVVLLSVPRRQPHLQFMS